MRDLRENCFIISDNQSFVVVKKVEVGGTKVEQKKLLHDLRKVQFLQSQYSRGFDLRLEQSSLVDPDCVSHLCCSAGLDLLWPGHCGVSDGKRGK